jgi:hypothetical protein
MLARLTGGVSPIALSLAYLDWSSQLAAAPQRQMEIAPRHTYQNMTKLANAPYVGPDEWLMLAPHVEGSSWPEWAGWLAARSSEPRDPPQIGFGDVHGLPDARRDYVHTYSSGSEFRARSKDRKCLALSSFR